MQNNSSILTRLIALSAASLAILAIGLIIYGVYATNNTRETIAQDLQPMARSAAEQRMAALAYQTVQPLQQVFQQGYDQASNLGEITLSLKSDTGITSPDQRRALVNAMVKSQAIAGKLLFGTYVTLEKNAFDGLDANYLNNAALGSNDSGRVTAYWTRNKNNDVEFSSTNEKSINDTALQEGIQTNWWYQCPLTTGQTCLIEPYSYDLDGTTVLLSSVIVPFRLNNKIIGSGGVDIKLDFVGKLIGNANSKIFNGKGRILLLSSSGIVAADSKNQAPIASSAKKIMGDNFSTIEKAINQNQLITQIDEKTNTVFGVIPFRLIDDSKPWVVVMEMPRNLVLADVDKVDSTIATESNHTIIGQSVTSLVLGIAALLVMIFMLRRVITPLRNISSTVKDIAEGDGDLTKQLPVQSSDEVGRLANNMNVFTGKLRGIVKQIKNSSDSVYHLAGSSASMAKNNADQIFRQQQELDMVSTAVQEMSHAVQEIARSATQAAGAAKQANHSADLGRNVVNKSAAQNRQLATEMQSVRDVIAKLESQSGSIVSILDVIRGIADQTNLLALNAAIEAARAGETGRGFAVVADEVRTLAQRTQDSTVEIQKMVNSIVQETQLAVTATSNGQKRVEESVTLSTEAEQALLLITESICQISDMNIQIAAAVEEQTAVTEEVSRNITVISSVANELADSATQAADASRTMANESEQLNALVDQFKV
jgi:methyl-accepting chemotaxis protein